MFLSIYIFIIPFYSKLSQILLNYIQVKWEKLRYWYWIQYPILEEEEEVIWLKHWFNSIFSWSNRNTSRFFLSFKLQMITKLSFQKSHMKIEYPRKCPGRFLCTLIATAPSRTVQNHSDYNFCYIILWNIACKWRCVPLMS